MSSGQNGWLKQGQGLVAPTQEWSFQTRSPLVGVRHAVESRECFAADAGGVLYRLNTQGEVTHHSRDFAKISMIEWSADGEYGVVCLAGHVVQYVSKTFEVEWQAKFREDVRAIAISPLGDYVAVALNDAKTLIYDRYKKKTGKVQTKRSLDELRFGWEDKVLIGTCDIGLLCAMSVRGTLHWSKSPWSQSGEMCLNNEATKIYVAAHSRGIQVFDDEGEQLGVYQIKGTPLHLACSSRGKRLATATAEEVLVWMNSDGTVLWAARVPDQVISLGCGPFGQRLYVGFERGEIACLNWKE